MIEKGSTTNKSSWIQDKWIFQYSSFQSMPTPETMYRKTGLKSFFVSYYCFEQLSEWNHLMTDFWSWLPRLVGATTKKWRLIALSIKWLCLPQELCPHKVIMFNNLSPRGIIATKLIRMKHEKYKDTLSSPNKHLWKRTMLICVSRKYQHINSQCICAKMKKCP